MCDSLTEFEGLRGKGALRSAQQYRRRFALGVLGSLVVGAGLGALATWSATSSKDSATCVVGGHPTDHIAGAAAPGTCVSARTTADPRVFGPHVWRALHYVCSQCLDQDAQFMHHH